MGLTKEQRERYDRDGFVLVEGAVPRATLARLRETTERLIDASRAITENDDVYDLDTGHGPNAPRLNRIKTPHLVDPVYDEYLRSDALLDLVRPLVGENVRLHNSKLNTKAAHGGAAVHWHQDWAFYPHTNDDLLAVGVMLSDVGDDDGPLQMVPGSHRDAVLSHRRGGVFCGAIDPDDPAARLDEAIALTGPAGSVSLHHVRTLHASAPNRGERPRLLLLYELGAADAWPIGGAQNVYTGLDQRALWRRFEDNLVAGEQPLAARLADVPVEMPLPPAPDSSSIFRIQASGGAKDVFGERRARSG